MHLTLNAHCVLKKGEPGVAEKGERGMDGLPGLKVWDNFEIANTNIQKCIYTKSKYFYF